MGEFLICLRQFGSAVRLVVVSGAFAVPAHARGGKAVDDGAAKDVPSASAELELPHWELEPPNWQVPTLHSLGLMTTMRVTEAYLWPDPFAETRLSVIAKHYDEAYTRPPKWDSSEDFFEWDGDPWVINAVGHALLGSELYYRPRACGYGWLPALGFATAGTVLWDYGYEASGVRPSALDLWYTPLAGMALGEVRYWGYRAASQIDDTTLRVVVQGIFDPFGQLERALGTPC